MLLAMNSPIATSRARGWLRRTESIGADRRARCARSFANTGLSSTRARTKRPTPISTTESRNGMRQPQDRNCSLVVDVDTRRNTRLARISPIGTPTCGYVPKNPRRPGRGVLDGHERGAAPLAAGREPLQQAQHEQQDRGGDADARVGGQQADAHRRQTHDQQGGDEHALAPEPVAEVARDDPAQRAGDEADADGRERGEQRGGRVERGEEQLAEHQPRRAGVDEEVVPLDGGADEARERDPAYRSGVLGGRRRALRHRGLPLDRCAGRVVSRTDVRKDLARYPPTGS